MPIRNTQELPQVGKIAALDVGTKTIGLAICDGLRLIAEPKTTLTNTKWKILRTQLQEVAQKEALCAWVVGLPLHMNGSISQSADRAMSFAHQLEEDLGLPVLLWDERLSTKAAEAALFEHRQGRQKRMRKKDAKAHVDSVAASLILQGVLDNLSRFNQEY